MFDGDKVDVFVRQTDWRKDRQRVEHRCSSLVLILFLNHIYRKSTLSPLCNHTYYMFLLPHRNPPPPP